MAQQAQGYQAPAAPGIYSGAPQLAREQFAQLHSQADPGKSSDIDRILKNLGTSFTLGQLQSQANLGGLSKRSKSAYEQVLEQLKAQSAAQPQQKPSFAPQHQRQSSGGAPALASAFSTPAMNQLAQFYSPQGAEVYSMMGYSPELASKFAAGQPVQAQHNVPYMIPEMYGYIQPMIATPYLQSLYGTTGYGSNTTGNR
jgi:hypothetical protein